LKRYFSVNDTRHICFLHSSTHNPILQIHDGTLSHGRAPDYGLYI